MGGGPPSEGLNPVHTRSQGKPATNAHPPSACCLPAANTVFVPATACCCLLLPAAACHCLLLPAAARYTLTNQGGCVVVDLTKPRTDDGVGFLIVLAVIIAVLWAVVSGQ